MQAFMSEEAKWFPSPARRMLLSVRARQLLRSAQPSLTADSANPTVESSSAAWIASSGNGALYRFSSTSPPPHHPRVFLAKLRGGTCTTAESDPPDSVIDRAMHLLHNGFGSYDVFENNCEDFVLCCKTGLLLLEEPGVGRSGQAASFLGVPLAALFSTPFKLLAAGPVGMAAVTAGAYCSGRYITDIGVRKDVMKVAVDDLAATMGFGECTIH